MKVKERRALLETHANPDSALDYVSGLHGTLQAFGLGKPTLLSIHYVPDRLIIDPAAFGRYLEALSALGPWRGDGPRGSLSRRRFA